MGIQDSIINGLCLTSVAFLAYKTDALLNYAKIIGLHKFKPWKYFQLSYIGRSDDLMELTPLEYLKFKWGASSFWASLIGCPYCFSFWLSFFIAKFNISEALSSYCVYIFLYKAINKF